MALRDSGGLEDTIDEYLDKMLAWMAEVKRVLKPTGSAVVNIGDLYGGGKVHSDWSNANSQGHFGYSDKRREKLKFSSDIVKPHDSSLLFIPFQFGWRCVKELDLVCPKHPPVVQAKQHAISGTEQIH